MGSEQAASCLFSLSDVEMEPRVESTHFRTLCFQIVVIGPCWQHVMLTCLVGLAAWGLLRGHNASPFLSASFARPPSLAPLPISLLPVPMLLVSEAWQGTRK